MTHKYFIKKILDENNPENTIVRVIFFGSDKNKYECVGVLTKDEENLIRVAFNAKDNVVVDYLDIKRKDIVKIEVLNSSKIKSI